MSNHRYHISPQSALPMQISFPFQEPAEGDAPLDGKLLYISTSRYDRDWNGAVHAHPFSEIFFVTGGRGTFHWGDQTLSLEKNALVITNPHVEHAESSQPQDPLEYIVLGIEGLEFRSGEERVLYLPGCGQPLGQYIRCLLWEAQNPSYAQKEVCQHLLAILLVMILRQREMGIAITAAQDVQPFCASAKAYIDAHYKESLTLDTLAQVVSQNKFYLVHAFTSAYGMSPIKYLTQRKMEEGKYLLAETDSPIAEVGAIIGFTSASHFTQAFKRAVGCTPNAYRKAQKEGKA